MVAGANFGTVLLWAAILGAVLKIGLAEGVGRWTIASGATMLDGWRVLGRWTTWFFGVYIMVWGFAYGATAMSAVGLPLNALFGGLSVRYWAMIAGVVGLVIVWAQRYEVFEKFVSVLVAREVLHRRDHRRSWWGPTSPRCSTAWSPGSPRDRSSTCSG